jgi:DNA-binding NtrC family response regulator
MPKILIVDDDNAIRGTLYDLLSESYECNTASMAEEALQCIEVEKYDAILTDIAMPGLTGVELLKRVQVSHNASPVILISGRGCEQDADELIGLGAFAYLTKPFNLAEIEDVVARAVSRTGS